MAIVNITPADGEKWIWLSDIHIPIDNTAAVKIAIDVAEYVGVDRVIAGGDILDFHCISKHAKDPERVISAGTIEQEISSGRWLFDWFATRSCEYILGNHEDRWDRFVGDNPELFGITFRDITKIPASINVLPVGSEIRAGSLVFEHGDGIFKRGNGGRNPAQRLLDIAPNQSTIIGHLHRQQTALRTFRGEDYQQKSHGAWTMGHLSIEHFHHDYVSSHPNWQTGFGIISFWRDGSKVRYEVTSIQIHFDRRNRPYCSLLGKVFK